MPRYTPVRKKSIQNLVTSGVILLAPEMIANDSNIILTANAVLLQERLKKHYEKKYRHLVRTLKLTLKHWACFRISQLEKRQEDVFSCYRRCLWCFIMFPQVLWFYTNPPTTGNGWHKILLQTASWWNKRQSIRVGAAQIISITEANKLMDKLINHCKIRAVSIIGSMKDIIFRFSFWCIENQGRTVTLIWCTVHKNSLQTSTLFLNRVHQKWWKAQICSLFSFRIVSWAKGLDSSNSFLWACTQQNLQKTYWTL